MISALFLCVIGKRDVGEFIQPSAKGLKGLEAGWRILVGQIAGQFGGSHGRRGQNRWVAVFMATDNIPIAGGPIA